MLPQLQPLLLVYSEFQPLAGLVLGGCKCPGFCSFLPGLLVNVYRIFVVISDDSLYFCGISGDIPFIIFHCIYLILLSFFFNNLASSLPFLLTFSKKPALGFIDFLKDFLCLYLLQFSFDLSYFLSSSRF